MRMWCANGRFFICVTGAQMAEAEYRDVGIALATAVESTDPVDQAQVLKVVKRHLNGSTLVSEIAGHVVLGLEAPLRSAARPEGDPAEYGRLARAEIQGYRCQVNEGIALYDAGPVLGGLFQEASGERAGQ